MLPYSTIKLKSKSLFYVVYSIFVSRAIKTLSQDGSTIFNFRVILNVLNLSLNG